MMLKVPRIYSLSWLWWGLSRSRTVSNIDHVKSHQKNSTSRPARVIASVEASHTASSQSAQRHAAFAIAEPCVGVQWIIRLHWRGHAAAYSHGARDPEWLESGVARLFRVLQRELRRRAFSELSRLSALPPVHRLALATVPLQRARCGLFGGMRATS